MKAAFERNGGKILQGPGVDEYLLFRARQDGAINIGGVTSNAKEILLPASPTRTAVFEEFIHTAQYRTGRVSLMTEQYGNVGAMYRLEIEAAEKLIRNRHAWQLPNSEIRDVIQRLRGFRSKVGE